MRLSADQGAASHGAITLTESYAPGKASGTD